MKKFNDILNESLKGELDNHAAVQLIVNDYKFIKSFLCNYIFDQLSKISEVNLIKRETIVDNSMATTILYDSKNDPYIKYLAINFDLEFNNLCISELDVVTLFTSIRDTLLKSFKLCDDAILKGRTSHGFTILIDYESFIKSDLCRSIKGITKYNL